MQQLHFFVGTSTRRGNVCLLSPQQFAPARFRSTPLLRIRWLTSPPLRRPWQPPATASRPHLALPLPCHGGRPCCRRLLLRGRGGEWRRWPGPPRAPTRPVSLPCDEPRSRAVEIAYSRGLFVLLRFVSTFKYRSNLHQFLEVCRGDSIETL